MPAKIGAQFSFKNQLSFHSYFTQANSTIMANIIIGRILTATRAGTGVVIHYQYYVKVEYNSSLLRPQLILKKKISCSQNLGFDRMDCT